MQTSTQTYANTGKRITPFFKQNYISKFNDILALYILVYHDVDFLKHRFYKKKTH